MAAFEDLGAEGAAAAQTGESACKKADHDSPKADHAHRPFLCHEPCGLRSYHLYRSGGVMEFND
jgi:hypothetical protein